MKTRIVFLSALLLIFSTNVFASRLQDRYTYYPTAFYQNVEKGLRDQNLKDELFHVLNSAHSSTNNGHDALVDDCRNTKSCYRHTSLGYSLARKILFGELHLEKHGNRYAIRDVYCQHLSTADDFHKDPPGPGQIPDPNVLNTEHTWPQSRFNSRFEKDLQKSDLHILYPAIKEANTSRSNHEFNDVVSQLPSPCSKISQRGYATNGSKKIYFEPPQAHKGNVARSLFYFSVRYQLKISHEEEASLRAWHRADPVDDFERQRNETIFAKQKVRNPFIDHPELAEMISDF